MIKIKLWTNNISTQNINLIKLLKKSFNTENISVLNLVPNKTYVILIVINNIIIGTVSLISNDDLISYFKTKTSNIESMIANYSMKATSGVYIYNLAVNKDFRHQGIAKKLLNIAIYVAKLKKFNIENVFRNKKNKTIKLMTSWL